MIRVLIADDHPIVRSGLRSTLSETTDIRVVAEVVDGLELLEVTRTVDFDVLVLDLSMPGKSGFDALKELMLRQPPPKVLVLSTYSEKQYAIRCLRAGALGYLTKISAGTELAAAIRKVSQGRKYVSGALAEQLADVIGGGIDKPLHDQLSDREFQVLCLLGEGRSVKEAADQLNLSVPTVSTYRARILEKLKLETTAQLIVYVLENRLNDSPR